jgi:DoxX-like family
MGKRPGIYVEILIRSHLEKLWAYTQTPELHQPWDLRFTTISYLPRPSLDEPQRFNYTTRIGFGLQISGEGESTGAREEATGQRTSALKFWSADPKSLIREGSGYWQYIPVEGGVRFLTWYDYRTRFGIVGRLLDKIAFRPLIGWATAWSFDRLRLHIDEDLDPKSVFRFAAIHLCSRLAIAFIWLWQGLVPKLLLNHVDERAMLTASQLPIGLLPLIGALEIVIAAIAIITWRKPWFFLLNVLAMLAAFVNVAAVSPSFLFAAFNPVTLNLAMIALSITGYFASIQLPTATRCLRQPPRETT